MYVFMLAAFAARSEPLLLQAISCTPPPRPLPLPLVNFLCDLSLRHHEGQLPRRRKPSRLDDRPLAHRRAPTAVLPVRIL